MKWLSYQAPVPLSIFRSNSKFDENSELSTFEYTQPTTTIFCTRHDSDTVVTCAKYRCDRSYTFYTRVFWIFIEFDRNMLSGTGARSQICPCAKLWPDRLIIIKIRAPRISLKFKWSFLKTFVKWFSTLVHRKHQRSWFECGEYPMSFPVFQIKLFKEFSTIGSQTKSMITEFYHLNVGTDTVEFHYNTVQYNKILHISLRWQGQNINQRLNLQKTHHRCVFCENFG